MMDPLLLQMDLWDFEYNEELVVVYGWYKLKIKKSTDISVGTKNTINQSRNKY